MINSAYLAGIADSDGSFTLAKIKAKDYKRKFMYKSCFQLTWLKNSKSNKFMNQLVEQYGGSYCTIKPHNAAFKSNHKHLKYNLSGSKLLELVKNVLPFLIIKKEQAQIVFSHQSLLSANTKYAPKSKKTLSIEDKLFRKMKKVKIHD